MSINVFRYMFGLLVFMAVLGGNTSKGQVTLVENGQARCAIFVSPEVMAADLNSTELSPGARQLEADRQRLRESVQDLTTYLSKMTGAKIEVRMGTSADVDSIVPILIGELAEKKFGPPRRQMLGGQSFRYTVAADAVGLNGESDLGTSYAIYELLHRLGCRWFMPSELGESIPHLKTIQLSFTDEDHSPHTYYRDIWHSDPAYSRRNRAGGIGISAGHALESYITKEQLEQHPDWNAEIGGERKLHPCDVGHRLCWANPEVAEAIAEFLIAKVERDGVKSISLSPGDGTQFCECQQCRALDTNDWDSTMHCVSITDRYLHFANRIAERVAEKYPDVMLGFLAYVQFTRPPLREKVHARLFPQVAPISYSRAHPMSDENVPGNQDLHDLVEGWGRCKPEVSYYLYSWFLAESCAPNPLITKWSSDLPVLYENQCKFWQPEGITNFETSIHGIYLGLRLAWDPSQNPMQIVDELNQRFYGAAAQPMADYWSYVDQIWITTPEYSGCHWGHLRRFTPERLQRMRQYMDAAKAAAQTAQERARIQIADESLVLFERFMKMRGDLIAGSFSSFPVEMAAYAEQASWLADRYEPQRCFGKMYWVHSLNSDFYFNAFCRATYADAARIADRSQFELLTPGLLRQFRFAADPENKGEGLGWMKSDFDDRSWSEADVGVQTWSTLGHHDYMGSMWYRTTLADLPLTQVTDSQGEPKAETGLDPNSSPDQRTFLWLAATDGSAKVFVNGKHVPYVDVTKTPEGREVRAEQAEFVGYAQPASFDISEAIQKGPNCIAIQCVRLTQNELGTGGLLGPLAIYREK